jgi:hypothetical protein
MMSSQPTFKQQLGVLVAISVVCFITIIIGSVALNKSLNDNKDKIKQNSSLIVLRALATEDINDLLAKDNNARVDNTFVLSSELQQEIDSIVTYDASTGRIRENALPSNVFSTNKIAEKDLDVPLETKFRDAISYPVILSDFSLDDQLMIAKANTSLQSITVKDLPTVIPESKLDTSLQTRLSNLAGKPVSSDEIANAVVGDLKLADSAVQAPVGFHDVETKVQDGLSGLDSNVLYPFDGQYINNKTLDLYKLDVQTINTIDSLAFSNNRFGTLNSANFSYEPQQPNHTIVKFVSPLPKNTYNLELTNSSGKVLTNTSNITKTVDGFEFDYDPGINNGKQISIKAPASVPDTNWFGRRIFFYDKKAAKTFCVNMINNKTHTGLLQLQATYVKDGHSVGQSIDMGDMSGFTLSNNNYDYNSLFIKFVDDEPDPATSDYHAIYYNGLKATYNDGSDWQVLAVRRINGVVDGIIETLTGANNPMMSYVYGQEHPSPDMFTMVTLVTQRFNGIQAIPTCTTFDFASKTVQSRAVPLKFQTITLHNTQIPFDICSYQGNKMLAFLLQGDTDPDNILFFDVTFTNNSVGSATSAALTLASATASDPEFGLKILGANFGKATRSDGSVNLYVQWRSTTGNNTIADGKSTVIVKYTLQSGATEFDRVAVVHAETFPTAVASVPSTECAIIEERYNAARDDYEDIAIRLWEAQRVLYVDMMTGEKWCIPPTRKLGSIVRTWTDIYGDRKVDNSMDVYVASGITQTLTSQIPSMTSTTAITYTATSP